MSSPAIYGFIFDQANEEEMSAHGVSPWQTLQVLENESVIVRNKKRRRGLYLLIGRDHSGQCLAIPIESTHERGIWRPVTAWYCNQSQITALERA